MGVCCQRANPQLNGCSWQWKGCWGRGAVLLPFISSLRCSESKLGVSGEAAGSARLSHSWGAGAAGGPQTMQRLHFMRVIHCQTAALHGAFPVPPVLPFCQQNRFCFPLCNAEPRYDPSYREQRIFISHLCSLWESGPRPMSYYRNLSGKGKTQWLFLAQAPSHSPNPQQPQRG